MPPGSLRPRPQTALEEQARCSQSQQRAVSPSASPSAIVPAAEPEVVALENRGEASAVEHLQLDTVRIMSICASAADGADAAETAPEIEALAQEIAATLKKSARESRSTSQRGTAKRRALLRNRSGESIDSLNCL